MARGGYRPGAGRPKGAKSVKERAVKVPADVRKAAQAAKMSPLDYMLGVMNDPEAEDARRDRMAGLAAPYVHPKAGDEKGGKKEQAARAAETAGEGTDWGDDLSPPDARLN